jgi:hypothetical protein
MVGRVLMVCIVAVFALTAHIHAVASARLSSIGPGRTHRSAPTDEVQRDRAKQGEVAKAWDISSTASALTEWASQSILAERLDISARILAVRQDGCYIDAGSQDGVTVGMIFEVYRVLQVGGPEEVAGEVQVAWTREDYSFAEPRGGLSLDQVSTLHFARLVNKAPAVAIIADTTEGAGGPDLDRLLQAVYGLLGVRGGVRPVLGEPGEPAWRLVIAPDAEGFTLRVSLARPGGEVSGTIALDPLTGERIQVRGWLDPSYLAGTHTPFEHFMAPPGRRSASIACGDVVPGTSKLRLETPHEELAVMDGSDLWIYDLSMAEPRLVSSLSVSIPPGPVRHRDDGGALELVDLDGDGLAEICLAPPGAARGEAWELEGDNWVLLEYLPNPPRASDSRVGAVIVGPYLVDSPALDPSLLQWVFPLSERAPEAFAPGFALTDIAILPGSGGRLPEVVAVDTDGTLRIVSPPSDVRALDGVWGSCVAVAMSRNSPLVLATAPTLSSDVLSILDPYSEDVLAEFPCPGGPIIDIALGDIDGDGRTEILVAVLEEEGMRIYY